MSVTCTKPHFKHDCEDCIYLGSNELADYYCCGKQGFTTLISRFSSNPQDYFSMPMETAKELVETNEIEPDSVFALCYRRYLEHIKH